MGRYKRVGLITFVAVVGLLSLASCGNHKVFTVDPPTIISVSPEFGARAGGTLVTVRGTNFTADLTVLIADELGIDLTLVDSTTITFLTPPAKGGTDAGVLVRNAGGYATLLGVFYYIPAPRVFGVSPNLSTPDGNLPVTIDGKGFVEFSAGPNTVLFGSAPATNVVTVSDTRIRCVSPPGIGAVAVSVTNANGTGKKLGAYRYFPPPTLLLIDPIQGTPLGGTPVTIRGTGFTANNPAPVEILFGSAVAANLMILDDNTITCDSPEGAPGLTSLTIRSANGDATLSDSFTYYPYPTLTSVTPDVGSSVGGLPISIQGSGFVVNDPGVNVLTIGGIIPTNIVIVDDANITCVTPQMPVGDNDIVVTNNNGVATLPTAFKSKLFSLVGTAGTTFFTVNATTGATTSVGNIGHTVRALAFHPVTEVLYAVTSNNDLITINLTDGSGTVVTSLSGAPNPPIKDLTFKGSILYGANYQGRTFEINVSTGVVTSKNSFGAWYGTWRTGLEWDPDTSSMYYMPVSGTQMYLIDPETGARSTRNISGSQHAMTALAYFNATLYGLSSARGASGGSMTLYRYNSSETATTQVTSMPSGFHTLAGTP